MENLLPGVPLVESPFASQFFSAPGIAPETRRIALDLDLGLYVRDVRAVLVYVELSLRPGLQPGDVEVAAGHTRTALSP